MLYFFVGCLIVLWRIFWCLIVWLCWGLWLFCCGLCWCCCCWLWLCVWFCCSWCGCVGLDCFCIMCCLWVFWNVVCWLCWMCLILVCVGRFFCCCRVNGLLGGGVVWFLFESLLFCVLWMLFFFIWIEKGWCWCLVCDVGGFVKDGVFGMVCVGWFVWDDCLVLVVCVCIWGWFG